MPNLIGQSLGRYHILEQLGEGGMATVYKAYDTHLETDVAIKVIRKENFTLKTMGKSLKRFEREARTLAKLTHPNIVKVTDYGEYEDTPYLVMPYIPGGTLKQRIRQSALSWQDAVRLIIPVARALEYAHQQGVIHRDIKPSNILLTQAGEPMLSDFGVAKMLEADETAELTASGMGVGTPEYMAPEQSGRNFDHRVDIYALGIVLYELLTGRRPYEADTPLAVLIKQASEPLPRPSLFRKDIPAEVEKILLKALAKKPEDRYQTMGEMAKALEGLIVVKAQPMEKKPKEPKKPSSVWRIDWKIPAVVVIVLLAMIALLALWQGRSVPSQVIPTSTTQALSTSPITGMPTFTAIATEAFTRTSTPLATNTLSATNTPVLTATALPVEITDEKGGKMRLVPAGPFIMGSDSGNADEKPVHTVTLNNYYMDIYEVTNGSYKACVDAGKCTTSIESFSVTRSSYYGNSSYDNYPVIYVDWAQAKTYCEWRGARLPTEAEWEKAARGTDGRTYPWGGGIDCNRSNSIGCLGDTTEVGSYESGKSPYGMYDMAGNVYELVSGWYDTYSGNKASSSDYGVIRGGAWDSNYKHLRSDYRSKIEPTTRGNNVGFRCARDAKP